MKNEVKRLMSGERQTSHVTCTRFGMGCSSLHFGEGFWNGNVIDGSMGVYFQYPTILWASSTVVHILWIAK